LQSNTDFAIPPACLGNTSFIADELGKTPGGSLSAMVGWYKQRA